MLRFSFITQFVDHRVWIIAVFYQMHKNTGLRESIELLTEEYLSPEICIEIIFSAIKVRESDRGIETESNQNSKIRY